MRTFVIALALVAGIGGITLSAPVEARVKYAAEISRTTYNIPHIRSDTWQGVGYGVAYAYAQDNFCLLAEEFVTLEGNRSRYFGPDESADLGLGDADNLTSDVFFRGQMDMEQLRAGWAEQSAAAQQLVDGYVAGYNRYLRDTGKDGLPQECRGAAWVRPITRDDMLRHNEKQMLLASSLALASGIANAAPPGSTAKTAAITATLPRRDALTMGSNGWAFGAEATADGRGLLIGNPHFPWAGPARFWQMHVTGPEGYNVMGAGLAGNPMPALGFNRDVAWTHTVTEARHFTLYALTLAPDDPTSYMVDGAPVKMTTREVSVPMPDGAAPVKRTLYATRFGPIVTMPNNGVTWNETSAFAMRDVNAGNQRAIDAWLGIGQAKNVGEVEAAVSETLGIPWVNTIAADRYGDALHADVTAVPNVSAEFFKACSTPLSALFVQVVILLDGTRSQCDWETSPDTPAPGLMPASDQAVRTARDYLTNSNDSYWLSNPDRPYRELSPILGAYEKALTLRTRSNYQETKAALAAGKIDHETARALVFANKSLAAEMVLAPLLERCKSEAELEAACAALAGWDQRFDAASTGAYLFARFWRKAQRISGMWQVAFDPADPVNTPRELVTEGDPGDKLIKALSEAASELTEQGIAFDAPWGEVMAVRVADGPIAIHGGPGAAGVLNMQEGRPVEGGMAPQHGTSYLQIVGFDETGPVADAVLSYSQSTNPASPHFADQTRLYAAKQMHRLPFTPEEIEAARQGEPLQLSE